ncbi:copper amine oxidase N-terminal domain-containing protein [Paenibacillus chitinolyticus]|uniref:copper amine oxidase N-terminal domain-containing protein n=1 Tax=Paenibacillus chitinolyticus TaxID=79263 RepID=UPI00386A81A1
MKVRNLLKMLVFGLCTVGLFENERASAATNEQATKIYLKVNDPKAYIDGKEAIMPTAPVLMKDTTMVPFRFIGELLGAEVKWEQPTRTVTLTVPGRSVKLSVGQPSATVNETSRPLDHPAAIVEDTTLVPLRFIAESLDRLVMYDPDTKGITITAKGESDLPGVPKPAEQAVKRLDYASVDTLKAGIVKRFIFINDPNGITTTFSMESLSGFTADNADNIYLIDVDLERNMGEEYGVSVINTKDGDNRSLKQAVKIDDRFNIQYKNKTNVTETISYRNLIPKKLYYDAASGKLYLIANVERKDITTVFYEIMPDVKLITYHDEVVTDNANNFFATLNGKEFFYSNTFKERIYKVEPGKEAVTTGYLKEGYVQKLVSSIHNGSIYLLDQESKTISRLREDGYADEVAKVKIDNIYGAAARGGYFYIADDKGFYKVDINGKAEDYVKLDDVMINQGLYDPKTKTYVKMVPGVDGWEDFPSENTSRTGEKLTELKELKRGVEFTVTAKGNIILFDAKERLLKRINIYPE